MRVSMLRWPFRKSIPEALAGTSRAVWAAGAAFLATVIVGEGFLAWESRWFLALFYAATGVSVAASLLHFGVHLFEAVRPLRALVRAWPQVVLVLVMSALLDHPEVLAVAGSVHALASMAHVFRESDLGRRVIAALTDNPASLLVVTFAFLCALGTVLLMLPRATDDGEGAPFLHALFTATSAACVTGLTVLLTARDALAPADVQAFSPFGQGVILLLIQVGGLGIMTLSTSAVLLVGGRLSLRGHAILQGVIEEEGALTVQRMVRHILTITLAFEAVGAAVLSWRFFLDFPEDAAWAVYCGVFHAISAFCNAGFSLFSHSLTAYATDPVVVPTVGLLIVAGGLGFMVIPVLFSWRTWSQGLALGFKRMPTHARAALAATAWLILAGAFLLLVLDGTGAQAHLSVGERLCASLFQSVSARTAGFNIIDIAGTSRAAVLVYLVLMFVGASPGGTGGGIKTTTAVLLLAAIRATLMGRERVEVFGRTIPQRTVHKAIAITALSFAVCLVAAILLLATQDGLSSEEILFEVVSAFGTVGLSLGATGRLDGIGLIVVTALMFIGRVGPLTMTLALARREVTAEVRYPEGKVLVG